MWVSLFWVWVRVLLQISTQLMRGVQGFGAGNTGKGVGLRMFVLVCLLRFPSESNWRREGQGLVRFHDSPSLYIGADW